MENIDKELGVAFESIADENRRWIQMLKKWSRLFAHPAGIVGTNTAFRGQTIFPI